MKFLHELEQIAALSETTREYEKRIAKFAIAHMSEEDIEAFTLIMNDPSTSCSYEAFYCLATIYRHQKDYSMLSSLITEAEARSDFRQHVSLKHIRIMYETHSESLYDYETILRMAHENACELPANSGYQHTFANAFATICENCLQEDLDSIVSEWYDSALYCVNRAIALERDYAKFYCTKARIVVLKNHYAEADRLIRQAIDLENSKLKDYPLLIGNYQYYRAMNAVKKQQFLFKSRTASENPGSDHNAADVSGNYHAMHSFAFISYSHSDRASVHRIMSKLKKNNVNFWYDGDLPGGSEWPEEIGRKLIDSQVVLIMISNTSICSKNVRNEITLAQNHKKRIIPIYIEKVELSPGAELQLQGYNSLYYYEMSEEMFLQKLLSSVSDLVLFNGTNAPKAAEDFKTQASERAAGNSSPASETETRPEARPGSPSPLETKDRIVILQKLCESKTGKAELNEDIIVANDSFIAVFDGSTSKTGATFQGKTGGQLASQFLADYLTRDEFISSSNMIDGKTAVCRMQAALRQYSRELRLEEQGIYLAASGVIYSISKRQIWAVGDCQFMINGKPFSFPKKVDEILAEARALSIHMLLNSGYTVDTLKENDIARGLILDELKMQRVLENKPGDYGYTVFSSQGELQTIVIKDVLPGSEVVLASDGYPVLYSSLEESEYYLREVLRNDPLCYREYKSTKGLSEGNPFVDDRSFIRFIVNE